MMRERSGGKWRAVLLPLALSLTLSLALTLAGCAAAAGGVSTTLKIAQTATPAASDTAPPSAPICQPGQLSTAFEMGSPATGNLTGSIWVWNTSATACSLEGAVSFAGLDAQHQPISGVKMNQPATLSLVELPPHTPALSAGVAPAPGAYVEWTIIGAYRDDPNSANGPCASANEVTPARFVVTIGVVSLSVKNYVAQSVMGVHAIEGCHGTILSGAPSLWS